MDVKAMQLVMEAAFGKDVSDTPQIAPKADDDLIYGMEPTTFEALVRYLLYGGRAGTFAGGRIKRDNGGIYVTSDPRTIAATAVAVFQDFGTIFSFRKTPLAEPFDEIANRMVEEGLFKKTIQGYYYRSGLVYIDPYNSLTARLVTPDVFNFLLQRYQSGEAKDIAAMRWFCGQATVNTGNTIVQFQQSFNDDEIHGVKEGPPGMGSFLTATRSRSSGTYQDIKPAGLLKKALRPWAQEDLTERDIENFGLAWVAAFALNDDILFLEGEDLRWAYAYKNHSKREGGGAGSCMSDDHKQSQLDFYALNPSRIKLAAIKDGLGLIMARCLIWIDDEGQQWYDRIYGSERRQRYMINWFAENNILSMQNDKRSYAARITLDNPWIENTPPYFDTVRYINCDGTLRREQDTEKTFIPIATSAIRRGWPVCPGCKQKATANDVVSGKSSSSRPNVPCENCINMALANPNAERISVMSAEFKPSAIVGIRAGILSVNGGIWAYDKESLTLVRIGDLNG